MRFPIFFGFLSLPFSAMSHEGHDHAEGVGTVVTTATVTGSEGHRYVTIPGWGAMSDGKAIGGLHGDLTLDKEGNVYAATIGNPGVVKFDRFGRFVTKLRPGLQGMHSLTTVEEDGKEFIWGSQLKANRAVKFDLEGNVVATLPNEKTGALEGGMGGLTEILVGPDGDIYFFMGYGSKKIHRLKPDGALVKIVGGKGTGEMQFKACHGAAIDGRFDPPRLLVCDRDGRRMMHISMDLEWIGHYGPQPLRRPADVDVRGDYAVVGEFEGRAVLMDKEGKIVSTLLDNPNKKKWATNGILAHDLRDSALSAPHGIKWGQQGQIYVTEYSKVGRIVALYPTK
ncbi:hypothetical protein N9067_03985 [Akkermansiaceae bacterium]|nr:hypothetical protein [Akkermansiaceae bacterium]MDB4509285.1 hypothetical protein [Akkermansiaceae bacterium]MDB4546026.1 hypothetical protein [Akkermansiaceae bacterium]MDB4578816.1 hypothetical protein [Akkermansiaceae bacterium]